jgi:glyoxylase-like metal-dependent hydrolase (beta-lactamase superfamily II)
VLTTTERALLTRVVEQWGRQLREFALVRPAPPTLLFDTTLSLDLGGRRVELTNRGHANSPSDVTVYLPGERVLFTGDIVVWPVPYTFDAYPSPWIRVLRQLEQTPAVAIVPGHGPVFTDFTYVRQVRELLESAVNRADSLIRTGMLRPQIERAVELGDYKARFVRPGNAGDEAMWQAAINSSLMERVYQCLVGSRC